MLVSWSTTLEKMHQLLHGIYEIVTKSQGLQRMNPSDFSDIMLFCPLLSTTAQEQQQKKHTTAMWSFYLSTNEQMLAPSHGEVRW